HGPPPERSDCRARVRALRGQLPTASPTHFLVKLVFAAPASFLSDAEASQDAWASFWHFVMKLFSAAPASFFAPAWSLHVAAMAEPKASDDSKRARAILVKTFLHLVVLSSFPFMPLKREQARDRTGNAPQKFHERSREFKARNADGVIWYVPGMCHH